MAVLDHAGQQGQVDDGRDLRNEWHNEETIGLKRLHQYDFQMNVL